MCHIMLIVVGHNCNKLWKPLTVAQESWYLTTQTATDPFTTHVGVASDHQCFKFPEEGTWKPFHALEKLLTSSSWFDQVPNFRQEIRQSHYRNDPVKYDLVLQLLSMTSRCTEKLSAFWFLNAGQRNDNQAESNATKIMLHSHTWRRKFKVPHAFNHRRW